MLLVRILSILPLLLLVACKTGPLADLRAIRLPPFEQPESTATTAPEPQAASTGTAVPKSRPPSIRAAQVDPEQLIGMNEDATRDLLGQPDSIGQEAQAQLWHYRQQPGCELVLFFYVDLATRSRHVLAYENRPAAGSPAGRGCTAEITAKRE